MITTACIPAWRQITPRDAGELAFAFLAADQGHHDLARGAAAKWEKRIGVTDFDRLSLDQRAEKLSRRRAQRAGGPTGRPSLASVLGLVPDAETKRLLNEAGEARLQAAQAAEASRRLKEAGMQRQADKAQDQAEAGIRNAERLERLAGARMDAQRQAAWSSAGLEERAQLSAVRGEAVVETVTDIAEWVRDARGVIVRDSRGMPKLGHNKAATRKVEGARGLMVALENGDLKVEKGPPPEQLWRVGTQYRDAYEVAARLLSAGSDPGQPAARASTPSLGLSDQMFEAFATLRRMRGQPMKNDLYGSPVGDHSLTPMSQLQIDVMDSVCGMDNTIRATAAIVRKRHAAVKHALVTALTVAKENVSS